ncbi:hypothetical protein GYMLUDRAFT_178543 [Collybiopsis luxurians FD-317 M1]|uniref:Unplaced genomic scaffold GYMLUscaffold_77, whole genome shotgun sequence n=1 Tax=Collybiopsis luxurians FD-317 M1 TaxID=944289 RepID=A0A0D0C725_9AGAR|nr:hypothetical protein GYMLUDRAFT_178543 [Collybiopsis luxurians FD-317 M1]
MSATNRILAGSPGDCCFAAFKHEGTPVGSKISIADIPTYFVEPRKSNDNGCRQYPEAERVLIFFADIWGPFYQSNMLLQDFFAQNGFTVPGIDYFLGDWVYMHEDGSGFNRVKWGQGKVKTANEVLPKWWEAVKVRFGDLLFVGLSSLSGYCFGAPYTMELSADPVVAAAAVAHPTYLNEDRFWKMSKPLMLSCAETDHTFPLPNRRIAQDILIECKIQYYFQIFSGVNYGFASRGDLSIPDACWAREQSVQGIKMWFHRFLDERSRVTKEKL